MTWQPIETAPKDGTPALVYASREGWRGSAIVCAFYHANQWRIYGVVNGPPFTGKIKSTQCLDEVIPSHWMPLPAPPA